MIVKLDEMYDAFRRAHDAVLKAVADEGIREILTNEQLVKEWEQRLNVKVVRDDAWGHYLAFEFPNDQAYTEFLLRYA